MSRNIAVTMYTRAGCHLCDEAKQAILNAACDGEFTLEEVDISGDPALELRYGLKIPVICLDGVEVWRYRLSADEFRSKLRKVARKNRG